MRWVSTSCLQIAADCSSKSNFEDRNFKQYRFVTIFVVDVLLIYASFHAQNLLLAKTCCLILVLNVTRG